MSFRIMMAGGGSGGHVYPLVAIAEELTRQAKERGKSVEMRFIGDGDILKQAASEADIPFNKVHAPKWRRYGSFQNYTDLLKIPLSIFQAFFYVFIFMPDVMLVKGGYASFFPAFAAKIMAIPLVVHESDSIPGVVNKWWGKMSRRVFLSFEHAQQYFRADRSEVVGNPIRPVIEEPMEQEEAKKIFGFTENKPTIFINGGSQGAQAINELVVTNLIEFVKKFNIIHQCGAGNFAQVKEQVEAILKEEAQTYAGEIRSSYQSRGHLTSKEMSQAYHAADVVVTRAGSALFEVAALKKPSIIIPLPESANDHQVQNAEEFAGHGGVILDQDNLTPHILINDILSVYERREELSRQIGEFARPDAAPRIAQELLSALS